MKFGTDTWIVVFLDRERLRKVVMARTKALLATTLYQRIGKRHEDARNNRWKGLSLKKTLEEELADAQTRCNTILQMINRMMNELPSLEPKMEILAIQIDLVMRAPRCWHPPRSLMADVKLVLILRCSSSLIFPCVNYRNIMQPNGQVGNLSYKVRELYFWDACQ